jgi:hypothetical protein
VIADPRFAPRRNDLPWLRRRRLPKNAAAAAAPAAGAPPLKDFITGHATGDHHHDNPAPVPTPGPPAPAPAPVRTAPAASSSLDLDEPATPTPTPATPTPATPTPLAPTRVAGAPSLDLDEAPPAPARPTPAASTPASAASPLTAPSSRPPRRRRADVRVHAGDRVILTPHEPTVTLTRLQTGIGTLTIEAAVSAQLGDLRLGAAYEFDPDLELTMQMTQGERFAPPHSKRPILLGSRERFERVSIDLRQCRSVRRLIVYGFSESRQPITWSGTLVVTTFSGARIEVPLESLQGGDIAVLLSIYQVRGEFVLRAEMQALFGDVREASRAYGYDKITWLDDRTPVE